MIFLKFITYSWQAVFSSSRNVVLNKFSIPAGENKFSVYLKQYSFIWRFFLLLETIGEILFLKITFFLIKETDFLANGTYFFLPLSDTPATDSFVFPSNRNVFVNSVRLV